MQVVGVASHRGIYLPLLLDPAHCSPNPLALAYVRGHYVGLVLPAPAAVLICVVLIALIQYHWCGCVLRDAMVLWNAQY
eukprot:1609106-Rhodomonas_salina.1